MPELALASTEPAPASTASAASATAETVVDNEDETVAGKEGDGDKAEAGDMETVSDKEYGLKIYAVTRSGADSGSPVGLGWATMPP